MPKWPKFPPNRNEARASGMPFADDSRDNDAHAAGLRASGDCGGDCCCATAVAADAASAGTASPRPRPPNGAAGRPCLGRCATAASPF
ncbi:hypothetical protein QWZ10_23590 [Paracoccus cavernae]|uniref:Uncharacterized protein n=1 Tax=Paracoccus cavernae TaxID=1571207 RepID=A0ABT8DB43_9RHOB|nr:hypothetical protein [Paracoccus cavernae]